MPKPARIEFPPGVDALSKRGAGLLAAAVTDFWARRGFTVTARRFQVTDFEAWGVSSDMVNGLPPRTGR